MIKNDTYDAFGRFFMPDILAWIKNEVKPEDVFDRSKLIQWASLNERVEDVYPWLLLHQWAIRNGYVKTQDIDGE